MKKLYVLIFLLFAYVPADVYGAELKMAYVDFNRALNESERGKKATAMLEEMIQQKKTVLSEKENEIRKLDEDLKKQASVLSQEAREKKEDAIKKLIRESQRMTKDFQEDVRKKETDLTRDIQKELVEIVNTMAKEEGYTVIFERGVSGILYFQEKYDITDSLIKRYDKNVKSMK
jgi:outer membrane protein